MKIIHILPGKANPERMNGVNKVVHQLASLMQEKGMDVTVAGITHAQTESDLPRPYPLKLFKGKISSFAVSKELKEFIQGLPADTVVHFHGVMIPIFNSLARILRKKKIAYVVTPHGALLPRSMRQRPILKKIYFHLVEKYFLRGAKHLHAITEEEKHALSYFKSVQIIPNGYPYFLMDQDYNLPGHEVTFGYVGRMAADHKGLDALIEGFALFYKKHQTGRLSLVGDGKDRYKLEEIAHKTQTLQQITFHGEHHGDHKMELLRQIDVFVHPSRWDVLPTTILEAAAKRKPLLVTQATGFAKHIRHYDCGRIIPNADPQDIATAMEAFLTLYRENKLAHAGRRAEQMIKEQYDWHMILPKIVSILYEGKI